MRKSDIQYGLPYTDFSDTKAKVEAISAPIQGMTAFATDTKLQGFYDGTVWVWGAGVSDHEALTGLLGGSSNNH